ncbi:MAG: hypothetical protein K6E52_02595 [Bacteroidaceae bacterium]|nr:hypothetical protein [Bacteroidaceae bacterium]
MKRILHTVLIFVASCTTSFAQIQLNHLDLSVTGGTTGLGFDLAAPINDKFRVRIGASFLPTHQKHMKFDTEVGDYNPALTPEQNAQQSAEKFQKLSSAFSGIAGETIDKEIDILGERSFNNFKLLVDYYPFKNNKHWHLTAGFYWGSSTFAKAYNTATCMTELMAVTMYNNMRKSAMAEEPLITYNNLSVYLPYTFNSDIVEYGDMSIVLGKYSHDIYAQEDILWDFDALDPISGAILHEKGDIRYAKGDLIHKAGDPYQMLPDEDNMVKVTAKTNSFRPYLGMGYETSLTKDKRTSISVNAGILLWGGSPEITTHEGINVKKDLMDLKGKFADNVNSLSHLNVYPVFTLRLTRRLF